MIMQVYVPSNSYNDEDANICFKIMHYDMNSTLYHMVIWIIVKCKEDS